MNLPGPPRSLPPPLLHGRHLLEAQREALVSGDLTRLGPLTEALREWLATLGREPGQPLSGADLAALLGQLEVNGDLAANGDVQAGRALQALLAGSDQTYDASGRATYPKLRPGTFSA